MTPRDGRDIPLAWGIDRKVLDALDAERADRVEEVEALTRTLIDLNAVHAAERALADTLAEALDHAPLVIEQTEQTAAWETVRMAALTRYREARK